jgi:VWFA-related protein
MALTLGMALLLGPADQQRFQSGAEGVRVDVLVTARNQPVTGLAAADFEVLDNGIPQTLDAVSIEDVPFSMLLVLDVSESVGGHLDELKEAAHGALDALQPRDRAALLTFSESVRLQAGWQQERAEVGHAIDAAEAGGGTALFDAAFTALTLRDTDPGRRSLVLLFSDGADSSSWLPESAIRERARRTDAVVYAVAVGEENARPMPLMLRSGVELTPGFRPSGTPRDFLSELAELTGGHIYADENIGRLKDRFARIVQEFRTRYLLTYQPQGVDSRGWHTVEVRLKNRRGQVRARRGYER